LFTVLYIFGCSRRNDIHNYFKITLKNIKNLYMIKKIENKRKEKKNLFQVSIRPLTSRDNNFKIIVYLDKKVFKIIKQIKSFVKYFSK